MKFSSRSPRFQTLASGDNDYQVLAVKQLEERDEPRFELSGTGALPHLSERANKQAGSPAAVVADSTVSNRAGALPLALPHTNAAAKTGSAAQSPLWAAMAGIILLVGAAIAARVSKMRRATAHELSSRGASPPQRSTAALDGLKDDFFQLEAARIRGSISEDAYASAREALEATVKRALV
jgi:hypothetical protein